MLSPDMGRFISPDPLGFAAGDFNLQVYCGNNGVNLVDPYGLLWDFYASLNNFAGSGYGRGGVLGTAQGWAGNVGTATLDTIGGSAVESTAALSGTAAGEGRTGATIGWGTTSGGLIAIDALSFGRMGQMLGGTTGKAGFIEFSHSIPARTGGPRAWYNGAMVSPTLHSQMDPYRFVRGMTAADKWPLWRSLINRLPSWAQGIVGFGTRESLESASQK